MNNLTAEKKSVLLKWTGMENAKFFSSRIFEQKDV
jgi:hypothetical protein